MSSYKTQWVAVTFAGNVIYGPFKTPNEAATFAEMLSAGWSIKKMLKENHARRTLSGLNKIPVRRIRGARRRGV